MNENTDKLGMFRTELEKISSEEAEKLLSAAQGQADSGLSDLKARLDEKRDTKVKSAEENAHTEEKKRVSEVRFAETRRVLIHRAEIVEEFFAGIEKKLTEKLGTKDYSRYLEKCLNEAKGYCQIDSGATILCCERDTDEIKRLAPEAAVEISDKIRLGGFLLKSGTQSAFADFTLDTVLAQERERFSTCAELQL